MSRLVQSWKTAQTKWTRPTCRARGNVLSSKKQGRQLPSDSTSPPLDQQNGLESTPSGRLDVKKRFSEEQIIGFLREADAVTLPEMPDPDLCPVVNAPIVAIPTWRPSKTL